MFQLGDLHGLWREPVLDQGLHVLILVIDLSDRVFKGSNFVVLLVVFCLEEVELQLGLLEKGKLGSKVLDLCIFVCVVLLDFLIPELILHDFQF